MVKLALRGSQDPTDSSLQMKVNLSLILDQTVPCYGKKAPYRTRPQSQGLCFEIVRKKQRHRQIQILVPFEKTPQDQKRTRSNSLSQ